MNAFKKIGPTTWGIAVSDPDATTGSTVTVTKRNGETQQVTLAEQVGLSYGQRIFTIASRPQAPAQAVGDLTGILAVFNHAKQHLKYPAIVLDGFRVSVAGARAANPGSLNVTAIDKTFDQRRGTMTRAWFGRVSLDGTFAPGMRAPADLGDKLRKFAADPAGEAAAYGKLTGRCCFCHHVLGEGEDRRSVEVGYGPICADHFGLPWGVNPEAEMQRMEAEGDRAQTAQDEAAKHEARRVMESGSAHSIRARAEARRNNRQVWSHYDRHRGYQD